MEVSLKVETPNIEETIIEIARVSSSRKNKKKDGAGLINYLIRNNHWSPFEHGFMTWEIVTSKAIAIQLLRHRSNFFQEFSQRYQDVNKVTEDNTIFELYEARAQAETNRQSSTEHIAHLAFREGIGYYFEYSEDIPLEQKRALSVTATAYNRTEEAYNLQLKAGIARECARFVLPVAIKTRLYVTMNVRSLVHWLDLRDDGHAQKEVQLIAKEIKRIAIEQYPIIAKARNWKNG